MWKRLKHGRVRNRHSTTDQQHRLRFIHCLSFLLFKDTTERLCLISPNGVNKHTHTATDADGMEISCVEIHIVLRDRQRRPKFLMEWKKKKPRNKNPTRKKHTRIVLNAGVRIRHQNETNNNENWNLYFCSKKRISHDEVDTINSNRMWTTIY